MITTDSDNVTEKWSPPLLRAFTKQKSSQNAVWFMRQAGRSLPEYRKARENTTMLESCLLPELAAEITCQPVRRHHVDGAVFFSDIMVPLKLAGVGVQIKPGIGPVMEQAVRSQSQLDELVSHHVEDASVIQKGVELVVSELGSESNPRADGTWTPVIAFAGAPFTLAAYLVEGKPSKDHLSARSLMLEDPKRWQQLMNWCAQISIDFMQAQAQGGARVFQLFDSWAGSLGKEVYEKYVAPYSDLVLKAAREKGLHTIHFGTGTASFLARMGQESQCVGVDYRIRLKDAIADLRAHFQQVRVQGNLDPAYLAAPQRVWEEKVSQILRDGTSADGHIFNLGHGVPPTADPGVLTAIVDYVHSWKGNHD